MITERSKTALTKRLGKIIDFVTGKTKEYKYTDLQSKEQFTCVSIADLPCEFILLMNDPDLVNKQKTSLRPDVWEYIKQKNTVFEFFTNDHLHPVPNTKTFDVEKYNPTMGYYGMKNSKSLWLKKSGEVRLEYIKHLL